MSGTAMWRLREQYAAQIAAMPINQNVPKEDVSPPKAPNIFVDAVSIGGSTDTKQKSLVRHVLIKNFDKAARSLKFSLPTSGIFADKAPVGLSAIFDGQSCASEPGPLAAEFCARSFHLKLLEALSKLESNMTSENFIKAVLIQTFEELDNDLLSSQQDVMDGCGAVVCLTIGDYVFVVQLGRCAAVLCEMVDGQPRPIPMGGGHTGFATAAERTRLAAAGAMVVGNDSEARVQLPNGTSSAVSRSLGDRRWKGVAVGGVGLPVLSCEPMVQSIKLQGAAIHPHLLLCNSSVPATLDPKELVVSASTYQTQPRAACGQIALQALEAQAGKATGCQCTVVQLCFLPAPDKEADKKKDEAAPPAKKPKLGTAATGATKSMRLRHILVKFVDGQAAPKDAKGKQVTRTKEEAEGVLRGAIHELRKDCLSWRQKPKGVTEVITLSSPKFTALCRALSECATAKQGGSMCGDLSWVSPEQRGAMGGSFKESTEVLQPGSWSDITASKDGLHLVQRLA